MPPGVSHPHRALTLACLGLIFLAGIIALAWTFVQPADPDSAFLLGYSPVRWALAGVIFLLTGLAGALALDLLRGVERGWRRALAQQAVFPARLAAASLGLLVLIHAGLLALASVDHSAARAVFTRLLPLGVFLGLAALLVLLAAAPAVRERRRPDPGILRAAGWASAGLALAGALVLLTGLGMAPVSNGWYEYGVPLVHQQVLYLLYGLALVLLAGLTLGRRPALPGRAAVAVDIGLALALWLAAAAAWGSQPVPSSWFSPPPLPPNFEVYPHSDALSYDLAAQGALLGSGWSRGEVHYKPLYVAFLALLRAAAGQDYQQVIRLQTLALALFPAALYLLGSRLHSRAAGLLAGLAAILREMNQLSVASLTTLSSSKLLLSELPTALGISALLVVLAAWLRAPGKESPPPRLHLALLVGGIVGLLAQVRLQTVLFLPALVGLLFIYYSRQTRAWAAAAGAICLGFLLAVAPLALRNRAVSGTLALEKPGYFERTLSYSYDAVPGAVDPAGPRVANPGAETRRGTGRTAALALHHFAHNTVSAFLVLPGGVGSGAGWTRARDLQRLFWIDPRGPLSLPEAAWLVANMALAALGAAAAWRRAGWTGLLPALAFGVYNLSSALGGFSGQRFILPVDWVAFFYYMAGLAWLAAALLGLLGWDVAARLPFLARPAPTRPVGLRAARATRWKAALVAGLLLLAGGLLPLVEALVPLRYAGVEQDQARAELLRLAETRLAEPDLSALRALLEQPGSQVLRGVALCPRAIESADQEAGILRYTGERTYPLLAYVHLGGEQVWVLQPLETTGGIDLPAGAEVLVAGARGPESFRAFATARLDGGLFLFSGPDR
jgi:hypothetical protein